MLATASRVRSWLLLEQPGPWGRDALLESRLDRAAARTLAARARRAGVRVLLIRRLGRAVPGPRQCFVAHTGLRARWVERRQLAGPAELDELDLARLGAGERAGFGDPVTRPLYLACTNGRHDRCCATYGRPLARALDEVVGERVWECSHVGGDRFAGNLVCFPDGLYFGRVGPRTAPRVAGLYERGLVDLDHYRGRSCYEPVVQAAEHLLRQRTGLRGVDDLVLARRERAAGGEATVWFVGRSGSRYRVRLRATRTDEAWLLCCDAPGPSRPPTYALLDLRAEQVS